MRIWIFSHYAGSPEMPYTRNYDLSKELVRRGHAVTIFASSFSYYRRQEQRLFQGEKWKLEDYEGVQFIWLKTIPYKQHDWRRVMNMLSYSWRAFWVALSKKEHPQVVIGTCVHPFAALTAYVVSVFKRAGFVFEVTDLWPQTLVDMGVLSEKNPVTWALRALEKFLYKRAKKVLMLWPYAHLYTTSLGIPREKVVWTPHPADFSRLEGIKPYDGTVSDCFTVMFLGGQSAYHGLDVILEAASILQRQGRKEIRFVIVGEGPNTAQYVQRAEELQLQNTEFRPLVPKTEIAKVMNEASAFIFHIRKIPLLKEYGISTNKLVDYLSSGRPIIYAVDSKNNPVKEAGAGISVEAGNPHEMVRGVLELLALAPEQRAEMGRKGRAYAERYHDVRKLGGRLESVCQSVVSGSAGLGAEAKVE